jgi:methylene-tetrahydromethanopterin dehydrogenase
VPPLGLEGVAATDDAVPIEGSTGGARGIGALALGNVKYRVQLAMLTAMRNAEKALFLDYRQALEQARRDAA